METIGSIHIMEPLDCRYSKRIADLVSPAESGRPGYLCHFQRFEQHVVAHLTSFRMSQVFFISNLKAVSDFSFSLLSSITA